MKINLEISKLRQVIGCRVAEEIPYNGGGGHVSSPVIWSCAREGCLCMLLQLCSVRERRMSRTFYTATEAACTRPLTFLQRCEFEFATYF